MWNTLRKNFVQNSRLESIGSKSNQIKSTNLFNFAHPKINPYTFSIKYRSKILVCSIRLLEELFLVLFDADKKMRNRECVEKNVVKLSCGNPFQCYGSRFILVCCFDCIVFVKKKVVEFKVEFCAFREVSKPSKSIEKNLNL